MVAQGTKNVFDLTRSGKKKELHYISTVSVGAGALNVNKIPKNGYGRSKWVAEYLVQAAMDNGLPAAIYRVSRISGHSQTGYCILEHSINRLLFSFLHV